MTNNDIVTEWIRFSKNDLITAKYLYETLYPKQYEIICYHCQQSIEKILKAFLIYNKINPPKIHELNTLCEICEDFNSSFKEIANICSSLSKYGIAPRYPYELNISDEDTKKALQSTIDVFDFVSKKLNICDK